MANRTRTNRNEFHLSNEEQYILEEKFRLSGMKSKSAFLRKLILDEKIFISAFACSPETATIDFKYTLDHCRENNPNKAYHLIFIANINCEKWLSVQPT